jgi:hypothetical protein
VLTKVLIEEGKERMKPEVAKIEMDRPNNKARAD